MKNLDFDIRQQFFRISEIIEKYENNNLIISENRLENPAYFIDSIFRGIPTQNFYFSGNNKPWELIDGNKRFNAIIDFINNKFPLILNVYDNKVNGLFYGEISLKSSYLKSVIKNYTIVAQVINPNTKEVIEETIKRIKSK